MWETLSLPWQACLEETWAAYCAGTIPIGACLASPDGTVIARARNRILDTQPDPGFLPDARCLYGTRLAHAEMNLLLAVDLEQIDRRNCALYTSTEPCPLCMGAIYMAGIRSVHFASRDPHAGSTNLLGATPYLSLKPVKVYGPPQADLETVLMALVVEFELGRLQDDVNRRHLETWSQVIPAGVELGKALHQSGELLQMRQAGASTESVFDHLIRRISALSLA